MCYKILFYCTEEMVSSTNNIFWSPDGHFIAYVVTNDTDVERIEFSKYEKSQYPEMVGVKSNLSLSHFS